MPEACFRGWVQQAVAHRLRCWHCNTAIGPYTPGTLTTMHHQQCAMHACFSNAPALWGWLQPHAPETGPDLPSSPAHCPNTASWRWLLQEGLGGHLKACCLLLHTWTRSV